MVYEQGGELRFIVLGAADLLDVSTIEAFAAQLRAALLTLASSPESPVF
jgi:hypothetical protein